MSEDDLPEGWRRVALCDLGEVRLGRQRSPDRAQGPHMRPYMRAANVGWHGVRLDDVKQMDFRPDEFETYALRAGDILVGEASGSRDEVGKSCVWNDEVPGACFQNTLVRVRLDASKAEPAFIQHHLQHDARRGALAEIAKGIGIHHLGREGLAHWEVAVPPIDEQRRIVAKLDALRARSRRAKDALDAVPALLDRLRQSILAAAFRGDLTADWREENPDVEPASELLRRIRIERRKRWEEAELAKLIAKGKRPKDDAWKAKYVEPEPVDDTDLPELPDGWCWARAEDLASADPNAICAGPFGTIFKAKDFRSEGVPIIFLRHVAPGRYLTHKPGFMDPGKWDELFRPYSVVGGELLVTKLGEPPGVCAVYPEGLGPAMVTPDVIKMEPDRRLALPAYLMRYFNSDLARGITFGVSYGMTRSRMTLELFREMPVPLAPRAEQDALVEIVEQGFARIADTARCGEDGREQLASLDAAILAAAFRGELLDRQSDPPPAVDEARP